MKEVALRLFLTFLTVFLASVPKQGPTAHDCDSNLIERASASEATFLDDHSSFNALNLISKTSPAESEGFGFHHHDCACPLHRTTGSQGSFLVESDLSAVLLSISLPSHFRSYLQTFNSEPYLDAPFQPPRA